MERLRQACGAGLNRLRHRHDQRTLAVKDMPRVDDRQPDDPLAAWCEAKDVALESLLAFPRLGQTDMQQRTSPSSSESA